MGMRRMNNIACDTLNGGDGVDYIVGDTAILFANTMNTTIPSSSPITALQSQSTVWLYQMYGRTS